MSEVLRNLATFLTNPQNKRLHAVVIGLALVVHLALHYATYLPALRTALDGLPYFKLHALHEAEFLLIVVYAGIVFRLRGGLMAVGISAVTSVPFLLTPYIFGRQPREGEITDLVIQVVFVLTMGLLMVLLQESVTRSREVRLALMARIEKANDQLESANRQLQALNSNIQAEFNAMLELLGGARPIEQLVDEVMVSSPEKDHITRFLRRLSNLSSPRV